MLSFIRLALVMVSVHSGKTLTKTVGLELYFPKACGCPNRQIITSCQEEACDTGTVLLGAGLGLSHLLTERLSSGMWLIGLQGGAKWLQRHGLLNGVKHTRF